MRHSPRETMQQTMRPAPARGGLADKRAFRRYAVSLPVLVQTLAPDAGPGRGRRARMSAALVTDISLSGLVFLSPSAYAPGTHLEVQIALGSCTHLIGAVVRRGQCVALPGRRAWQCAAQILRGEEATRFIPQLARYLYARGPREERREEQREERRECQKDAHAR